MGNIQTGPRARVVAALGLLTLGLATVLGAASASAAPPYATDATVTSVDFVAETVQSGSNARISATWELPDNAATPAGFVIDLPPELQGRSDAFPLLDGDGVAMGQCTVTATQVVCDFDDDYLAANPRDVHGDVDFWVRVSTEVTEDTEVTYDFGEVEGSITVTPPPGTCTEDCDFNGRPNYKWGVYDSESDTITWGIVVGAPATGMAGGQQVTVTDRPGPNQEIVAAWLVRTNEVGPDDQGRIRPINWSAVPASQYTVSDDLSTISFTSEEGYFYEPRYRTAVTDGGASETYGNDADITIQGQRTVTVTHTVESQGGSGTGSGTNVGSFSITKEVAGDAAAAEGVTFSGSFVVTPPSGDAIEGTFEVVDGETWTSDEFPRGSTVHLTEVTPTEPDTVSWADPEFSENDFTLGSGTTTAVTLTNEATLLTGAFSVTKVLEGDAADDVPADATFTVAYSYPAGAGYAAGSGELVVPVDGTVVESEQLPVGAVVSLEEITPDAIPGVDWGEPNFSPSTVTIGADETIAVTLTNTASVTPTPGGSTSERPPAQTPTTPGSPSLPATGADVSLPVLIGALLLVATGAALLVVRRRQQL